MTIISRTSPADLLQLGNNADSARLRHESYYEALVEDVIVDQFHKEYATEDGYNVGDIKIRIFSLDNSRDSDLLDWATPSNLTVQQYPLIGEVVIVHRILGKFYYFNKINLTRSLQESAILNLTRDLNNRYNKLNKGLAKHLTVEMSPDDHQFGDYFKPDYRVRQLKHFEGDTLLQGRMGHSIRFGSALLDGQGESLAPNLIIRTGQGKDLEKTDSSLDGPYGLILEDINKDASSIWMTSEQVVSLKPATSTAGSFVRSITNYPQIFSGAQLILNSDRLIFNSKRQEILLFSNEGIHLNSFNDTTIDTDNEIILTANLDIILRSGTNLENSADLDFKINAGNDFLSIVKQKTSFISDKIHIGSVDNTDQPLVGGTSLSIFLARLIMTIMNVPTNIKSQNQTKSIISIPRTIIPAIATTKHVITPAGPGILSPDIVKGLITLYNELATGTFKKSPFNSEDNFVMLQNELPEIELNDFKSGNQEYEEPTQWVYDDSYYDVIENIRK